MAFGDEAMSSPVALRCYYGHEMYNRFFLLISDVEFYNDEKILAWGNFRYQII